MAWFGMLVRRPFLEGSLGAFGSSFLGGAGRWERGTVLFFFFVAKMCAVRDFLLLPENF